MILKSTPILIFLFLSAYVTSSQSFHFGADLSYINEMEDCGAMYNDEGTPIDPYEVFSQHGATLVRLRLWHTPDWYEELNEGFRYSDLEDVKKSIRRAQENQLHVLLNFHLSDTWADPEHQVIPGAWAGVVNNLPVLQDSLYNYIYSTLNKLASEDLLPEIVQIGNETNRGILLSQQQNDSGWVLNWPRNSALFNTAISAIHEIEAAYDADIQIALHIADPSEVAWYIGQFHEHGVTEFDIIGISYYWQWHQHLFEEVGDYIASLIDTYPDKEVMILETAYPWTSINADGANNILSAAYPGYVPFTPARQKQWMIDLTQTVIDYGGTGVVYWEPGWVSTDCFSQWAQGSSWDNATFFDQDHDLMETGGIGWMSHQYDFISATDEMDFENFHFHISNQTLYIQSQQLIDWRGNLNIEIYSIDGKLIFGSLISQNGMPHTKTMYIPDLINGFYFIRISNDDHDVCTKLMIMKH